jgi:sigma-B regulation protein RsbU (phosphoserine phosphatase)
MSSAPDLFDRTSSTWRQRLDYIVDTMREVSRHTEPAAMVRTYTERMRATNFSRLLSLSRRGVPARKFVIARDTSWKVQPDPWRERDKLPVLEGGLLGELAYGNEARLIQDLRVPPSDPAEKILEGYGSLAAVPVFDGGEALNVVLFLREGRNAIDPEILPQLVWNSNLFGRATHSLVLSDQLQRAYAQLDAEMRRIADIQRSLLPREIPKIDGLDVAAYYRPARQAGGDYYDFFPMADGAWGLMIADVSGHGSPAAVEMAITRTLAHTRTREAASPAAMLDFVNRHLASRYTYGTGTFVTALFASYDPRTRELVYANAGHPPARLKRCADGSLLVLDASRGLPLGILPETRYADARVTLQPHDQIVFYTDGITEAFDPDNRMFGTERLDPTLENCALEASGLLDAVLGELESFTRGREAHDDRTLLVLRVTR